MGDVARQEAAASKTPRAELCMLKNERRVVFMVVMN
jgi:hypothetical protein